MSNIICPRCHRIIPVQQHTGDVVHRCDSTNATLNNEDRINIENPNWKMQGIENAASPKAIIHGAKVHNHTRRGAVLSTHYTRQHYQYINLEGD